MNTELQEADLASYLVKYEAMIRAIKEAHDIYVVKEYHAQARMLEVYAIQKKNHEAERRVREIREHAEIRLGELLMEMKEQGERVDEKGSNGGGVADCDTPPTLKDLGITRMQSSRYQRKARLANGNSNGTTASTATNTRPKSKHRARPLKGAEELIAQVELWANGEWHPCKRVNGHGVPPHAAHFRAGIWQALDCIPWLTVTRSEDGQSVKAVIDHELRALCESRRGRPELSNGNGTAMSYRDFYSNLRAEITRRRQENHDERMKSKWHPDQVLKLFQHSLLDWIEEELDRAAGLL